MPTNANTFNSRVTSEALEKKFREVFPSQGGAELVQDLFASGVITPVVDFSSVAEGSVLPEMLQTAWDFATGIDLNTGGTNTLITNTGFWLIQGTLAVADIETTSTADLQINDGATTKAIWGYQTSNVAPSTENALEIPRQVVFLRAGDSLESVCGGTRFRMVVSYRQIADVSGNLVNPLGFVSS